MFWKLLASLGVLGAASLAQADGHGHHYAVTGVDVDSRSGGVPLRQNINELYAKGGPQWDLYIRSLQALHEADASDPLSYFQIAGIHGKPYVNWDDSGPEITSGWKGYCPHGEKLFLPWHRPFVLAYEQVLVSHARRLAKEYPQRYQFQYLQAAESLRAPYWDWAADSRVPQATVPKTMRVNVPDGAVLKQEDVDNPLETFKFPQEALDGKFGNFDSENRSQIYRCPSPKSYPNSANDDLANRPYKQWIVCPLPNANAGMTAADQLSTQYDAFTRSDDFAEFASTSDEGTSLEQAHNGIHWDGACGGQFLAAEFSAFDPLFMLHHCNVDRLWAYWQAINPESSTFNGSYSGGSRYSTPHGTLISPDSPLAPFHNDRGEFHTSLSVDKVSGLGYTYQGLEYWDKSDAEMSHDAKQLINRIYGPEAGGSSALARRGQTLTRYFVRIRLEASEVERPCAVEVFVGEKKAGSFIMMHHPSEGIVHGSFALDEALDPTQAQRESVNAMVDSIDSRLGARIVKPDGSHIALSTVPSLEIELEDVMVTTSVQDDELPAYGASRRRPASPTEMGNAE